MKETQPPLVVPKPCDAHWSEMTGDDRKRLCAGCGRHVYNLSAMSEAEAARFAAETGGRECVAYVRSGEGKMLSANWLERMILRLAGWKPVFARCVVALLPAALASCISRPTAGVPLPPGKQTQERKHLGNTDNGVLLGEPIPVPGKARIAPDVAEKKR